MEKVGSRPNRAELRTFKLTFFLSYLKPQRVGKIRPPRVYPNPVTLAREWQAALKSGEYSSAAELARKLGVSRPRVCRS